MTQLQDTVIDKVQLFIKAYFADSLTDSQIEKLNEELEVKILAAFFEHGIPSTHKRTKHESKISS